VLRETPQARLAGRQIRPGLLQEKPAAQTAKTIRQVLDLATFEYRPAAKPALPALEMAKNAATLPERLRLLLANDPAKDKAAAFLWPFLASLWNFAADRIGEVASDAPSIDAPCAPASTGSSAHLKCGMRPASPPPSPA
jgi:3-hydroxyacyl-CoA dehydrogenase